MNDMLLWIILFSIVLLFSLIGLFLNIFQRSASSKSMENKISQLEAKIKLLEEEKNNRF